MSDEQPKASAPTPVPPYWPEPELDADDPDGSLAWSSMEETCRVFGIPWPLGKASLDEFDYAVGLRDGTVIQFERCVFDRDHVFAWLKGVRGHSMPVARNSGARSSERDTPFSFDRGLVIRLADVMWAADAPFGS